MPRFSEDDVLDFKVAEAATLHALEEQHEQSKKAEKDREIKAWKDAIKNNPRGG